jgi:hypothetical protein
MPHARLNDKLAEAKASLNRAISVWYSDVKRDDLGMGRMKRG